MSEIAVLMPYIGSFKASKKREQAAKQIVREVVLHATVNRPSSDLLVEVYLAGIWHGCETMRQNPVIAEGVEP